jgi:peptidylprolyl isomerase
MGILLGVFPIYRFHRLGQRDNTGRDGTKQDIPRIFFDSGLPGRRQDSGEGAAHPVEHPAAMDRLAKKRLAVSDGPASAFTNHRFANRLSANRFLAGRFLANRLLASRFPANRCYTFLVKSLLISALVLAVCAPAVAQTSSAASPSAYPKSAVRYPRRTTECAESPAAVAVPPGLPAALGPVKTAYALRYIDTEDGPGELAPATGYFTVHYTGWLASDGKKFDSSYDRGEPITFPVGAHRVIMGWDTGFQGMHVGGKRRLFIPYQLAYGEAGKGPIPSRADLIFDVELISVSDKPSAAKAAATPPASH